MPKEHTSNPETAKPATPAEKKASGESVDEGWSAKDQREHERSCGGQQAKDAAGSVQSRLGRPELPRRNLAAPAGWSANFSAFIQQLSHSLY